MKKLLILSLAAGALFAETVKLSDNKVYLGEKNVKEDLVMYDIDTSFVSGNFTACHIQEFNEEITLNCFKDNKFFMSEPIRGVITPEPALVSQLTYYKMKEMVISR